MSTDPGRDESTARLLRDVEAGVKGAWERLVGRYGRLALSVPRRMGLGEADAEDVFQTTWTILYQRIGLLRDASSLPSWILTIARHESWRVLRGAERRGDVTEQAAEEREPAPAGDELLERLEDVQLVREGIAALSPRCRELLGYLYLEPGERTYQGAAEHLGLALGSIGPTRLRCLARLTEVLAERLGDPEQHVS